MISGGIKFIYLFISLNIHIISIIDNPKNIPVILDRLAPIAREIRTPMFVRTVRYNTVRTVRYNTVRTVRYNTEYWTLFEQYVTVRDSTVRNIRNCIILSL